MKYLSRSMRGETDAVDISRNANQPNFAMAFY